MALSTCLEGSSYGVGLQVSSQSIIGFLLFTIRAKASYIVHRKSAAEASVPVVIQLLIIPSGDAETYSYRTGLRSSTCFT